MQRCTQSAAGGTIQRLYPGFAMMRSRLKKPGLASELLRVRSVIAKDPSSLPFVQKAPLESVYLSLGRSELAGYAAALFLCAVSVCQASVYSGLVVPPSSK